MKGGLAAARLRAFLGGLGLFGAAETLFAARPWEIPRRKRWTAHLLLAGLNSALLRLTAAGPLYLWTAAVWARGGGLAGSLGLRGPVEVLASFAAFDLFDYWWHRANHEIPFFWRFHRAHHLDTHVDVTTALRFHPGELLLSAGAKALWVGLWGPSPAALALAEAGITAAAQFHHANIALPARAEAWIRRAVMTPRLHASHHTVALRSRDANYSTVFSLWDRAFGTFAEPDDEELRRLGLAEGREECLSLGAFLRSPWARP